MKMRSPRERVRCSGSRPFQTVAVALCALIVLPAASGCERKLSIRQDRYVNNAMHHHRAPEDRTGEPLELTIVCVRPRDLEHDENDLLRPGADIDSAKWYQRRPLATGDRTDRFVLPREQVYLLTNERDVYGTRIGNALRGAALDGEQHIVRAGQVKFSAWDLHDKRSTIYVFGAFRDDAGNILPVKPAVFNPPGDYSGDLYIRIGVNQDQYRQGRAANWGQYIRNVTRPGRAGGEIE